MTRSRQCACLHKTRLSALDHCIAEEAASNRREGSNLVSPSRHEAVIELSFAGTVLALRAASHASNASMRTERRHTALDEDSETRNSIAASIAAQSGLDVEHVQRLIALELDRLAREATVTTFVHIFACRNVLDAVLGRTQRGQASTTPTQGVCS
jgi:hypothetical protein